MPEGALRLPVHKLTAGGKHDTWVDMDLRPCRILRRGVLEICGSPAWLIGTSLATGSS